MSRFLRLLIVFTVSLCSLQIRAAESLSCANLLKTATALKLSDIRDLPLPFDQPLKNPYEKQADYLRRLKNFQLQNANEAASFQGAGVFRLVVPLASKSADYDAEKGLLKINGRVSSGRSNGKPYLFLPYLVVEEERLNNFSRNIGFAMKANLTDPFVMGKTDRFLLKITPVRAQATEGEVALAIVGRTTSPWQLLVQHEYKVDSPYMHRRWTNNLAIVDVLCAAIVDQRSLELLHEFR